MNELRACFKYGVWHKRVSKIQLLKTWSVLDTSYTVALFPSQDVCCYRNWIVFQWTQRCRYTCCPLCPPQIHLYQQRIQLFSEMMPLPHVVLWGNVKWHFTEWMSSWTFWPGKNISRWLLSVLFVGRIICIMIDSVNLEAIYKKEKKEAPSVSFNLH